MDQECIYEEVGYRIEEVAYTTNVKRYKEYKRKGLYYPELVDSKGNVQPSDPELKGGAGTCYMMFIKCRIKNYSDTAKRIRASVPATGNYMKDGRYAYEGDNTYFTCSKKIEFDPDVIQLNPGEEVTCLPENSNIAIRSTGTLTRRTFMYGCAAEAMVFRNRISWIHGRVCSERQSTYW